MAHREKVDQVNMKYQATFTDLCAVDLRDEAEWLEACGARYEAAIVPVEGSEFPLCVLFVPVTGRAAVAHQGAARWLHASSMGEALERYLEGEGSARRGG
jgi:hypothetical protein